MLVVLVLIDCLCCFVLSWLRVSWLVSWLVIFLKKKKPFRRCRFCQCCVPQQQPTWYQNYLVQKLKRINPPSLPPSTPPPPNSPPPFTSPPSSPLLDEEEDSPPSFSSSLPLSLSPSSSHHSSTSLNSSLNSLLSSPASSDLSPSHHFPLSPLPKALSSSLPSPSLSSFLSSDPFSPHSLPCSAFLPSIHGDKIEDLGVDFGGEPPQTLDECFSNGNTPKILVTLKGFFFFFFFF